MDTLLADWSMYQSRYTGDPHNFSDKYNPAKYIVDFDFAAIAASGVAGVIIRTSLDLLKDPCFDRYLAGLRQVGLPWGIYHAFEPSRSVQAQIDFMRGICPVTPPLGVYADLERGQKPFAAANAFLQGLDAAYGRTTGFYSGNWYMQPNFTLAEQNQWHGRLCWLAGYPNLDIPVGWLNQPRQFDMHQFTNVGTLPGLPHVTCLDKLHPSLTIDHLLNGLPAGAPPVVVRSGRRRADQPAPPPPAPLTATNTRFGLHGRADGRMQPPDFQVVQSARIEAVKLMSTAAPEDVERLRGPDDNLLIVVRCFIDFRNRTITPAQFAQAMAGDLAPFIASGVTHFEVHNEPNLVLEGLGTPGQGGSWPNGAAFGEWFKTTVALLRQTFLGVLWGWPGLSPGPTSPGERADSADFMRQAGTAPAAADWIGLHAYWQSDDEMESVLAGIAQTARAFPSHKLYITEFANVKQHPNEDPAVIAAQYIKFVARLKRLPVAAAFAFVSSASDPAFAFEAWRDEQGQLSVIPGLVGARPTRGGPEIPAPLTGQWWEDWPEGALNPTRRLQSPPAPVEMLRKNGESLTPPVFRQNAMDVFERNGDRLRVLSQAINGKLWWVRAADVQPE